MGAAINGFNPASFDGVNDCLNSPVIESSLFSAPAGSIAILYKTNATVAAVGVVIDDPALISGAGGYFAAGINTTGPRAVLYDVGYKSIQITASAGTWHLFQMKWDGSNLKARVDSNTWSTASCGNMGDLTSAVLVGSNYNKAAFFSGLIGELLTAAVVISDADFNDIKSYVNTRYALSL